MSRALYWASLLLASALLYGAYDAGKALFAQPGGNTLRPFIVWVVLLAANLFVLAVQVYAQEKARGRVKMPVPLFEWVLRSPRGAGRKDASS